MFAVNKVLLTLYTIFVLVLSISIIELIGGIFSKSYTLIIDSIHYILDIVIVLVLIFGVKISEKPADKDHPYGHGKFKYLSIYTAALIMLILSIIIFTFSIHKVVTGTFEKIFEYALTISIVVLILNSIRLGLTKYGGLKFGEIVLKLEFTHTLPEFLTSCLIVISIYFALTIPVIDKIIAIVLSVYLMLISIKYLKISMNPLLDYVNPDIIDKVKNIVNSISRDMFILKKVRIKNIGDSYIVDLVIAIPKTHSLEMMFNIFNMIERELKRLEKEGIKEINIKVEPL